METFELEMKIIKFSFQVYGRRRDEKRNKRRMALLQREEQERANMEAGGVSQDQVQGKRTI